MLPQILADPFLKICVSFLRKSAGKPLNYPQSTKLPVQYLAAVYTKPFIQNIGIHISKVNLVFQIAVVQVL